MAAKPTEVKKLVALLDSEHDSAEALAKEVFKLVEEMIFTREHYVAIVYHPSVGIWQAIGPYPTRDKATKDFPKRVVGVTATGTFGNIAQLRHPTQIDVAP